MRVHSASRTAVFLLSLICLARTGSAAAPYISEFVANNTAGPIDEFGTKPDWIEIHNPDPVPVNLLGYFLTDDKLDQKKWSFPSYTLGANARLIVYASNRNLKNPTPPNNLHTNFKLSEEGEYLALTRLETNQVLTVLSEFDPFPLQFRDVSYGIPSTGGAPFYLNISTPGQANSTARTNVGPLIYNATEQPPRPLGNATSPALTITAEVRPSLRPIVSVKVAWRVMFNGETIQNMLDTGTGGDVAAGDGIFTAQIPTSIVGEGQMLRWRIIATDTANVVSTAPPYPNATDSDQYFGTVALDSRIQSNLPVIHWFVQDTNGADGGGARCSMFYQNEFYDNFFVGIHGQSTQGFPKKSKGFNFNADHSCQFFDNQKRVKGFNILSNYADKTKVRNTLSCDYVRGSGSVGHLCMPVRVQRNAAFYEIADALEQGDEIFLERLGRDPDGAFYKMYNLMDNSTSGVEKKTRKNEANNDLQALIDGIAPGLSLSDRRKYVYDNIDIPQVISYFVALSLVSDVDHGHKNYYLYRDTNITGEWAIFPWDVDLSWGHNWGGFGYAYFDDTIYSTNPLQFAVGGDRMYDLFFNAPELKKMYMRRMRSVMDELLQAPGTNASQLGIEARIRQLMDAMDPPAIGTSDADLDYQTWPNTSFPNGPYLPMRQEAQRIIDTHLPGRRSFLFNQAPNLYGEPIPAQQPAHPLVTIEGSDPNPVSGKQDEEYIILKNSNAFAVDISGWSLDGGVRFTFKPGTVIPPGAGVLENVGVLFVVRNPRVFRQRLINPRGSQFCYVQGPYDGQLSARGEVVNLYDKSGTLISTKTTPANPTPSQLNLRVTELNYAPLPPTAEELAVLPTAVASDFEFFEVRNLGASTLDLSGAVVSNAVDFTFPPNSMLAGGASTVVAGNIAAFKLRYGALPTVAGQFTGNLDNTGETLQLVDKVGEKVVEFTYAGTWHPYAKLGYSMVARTPATTPFDGFSLPTAWAVSGPKAGTPSAGDPYFSVTYESWLHDYYTLAEQLDVNLVGHTSDLDGDGKPNWIEYQLGGNPRIVDAAPIAEWKIVNDGGIDYGAISFTRRAHALDASLVVEAAADPNMTSWLPAGTLVDAVVNSDGTEKVTFRDDVPLTQARRVLRVRDVETTLAWIARIPQSISFAPLSDIPFQFTPLILDASSNSGLPVKLTVVSGAAELTGNSLKLTSTGAITISATQDGNAGYLPADAVIQTFTVGKLDQTVDFPALADRPFTFEPIPVSAHATSGLAVNVTLVSGPVSFQNGALFLNATGNVTMSASQDGNDIYNPAPGVQWTMHVSKGTQTINFSPTGNKQFLDPPFDLAATSTSGLPVTLYVVSGPGTLNGSTLTILGAGTIIVQAEAAGDDRIANANPVTQSILVNKAPSKISWPQPADVPTGTVLGPDQLNATADVAGVFVYTPPAGTVLQRNDSMILSVEFTPANSDNFGKGVKSTFIRVVNAMPKFESPPATSDITVFGAPVSFTANASDADNDTLTYQWDFGDGSTASGPTASHIYSAPGVYSAKVTVTDGLGGSTVSNVTVQVNRDFSVLKAAVKLNFQKAASDSLTVSGTLRIPSLYAGNKPVRVHIGTMTGIVTLDSKGKAKTSTMSLSIGTAKAGLNKFSIAWSKSTFPLEPMGFVNDNVKNHTVQLPLLIEVDQDTYQSSVPMTYSASKAKKGAAKYSAHK